MKLKVGYAIVARESLSNDYGNGSELHPDDHTRQTNDTPGFKPFTILQYLFFFLQGREMYYLE